MGDLFDIGVTTSKESSLERLPLKIYESLKMLSYNNLHVSFPIKVKDA